MVTKSNKRTLMRERTEKGSSNKMLNSFNNKIDELESNDFEESFNIDEMAKPHTWSVTYKDKYNKTKQHVIDAPDAYDAKMKARRELGIRFSDIDDAEMIEDVDRLDESLTGTAKKLFDDAEYDIVGLILTKLLKAAGKLTEDEFEDFVKALKSSVTEAFDTSEYSELVDALDSAKD